VKIRALQGAALTGKTSTWVPQPHQWDVDLWDGGVVKTEGDWARGGSLVRRGGWQSVMAVLGVVVMVTSEEMATAVSGAAATTMAAHQQILAAWRRNVRNPPANL
jgi:hypothetical protein